MRMTAGWVLAWVFVGGTQTGLAQYSSQPQSALPAQTTTRPSLMDDTTPNAIKERAEAQRLKLENDERHKRLLADTEKLQKLANDLRAEVEKSGKEELSVVVVRKAAEMEKLARDVKDRMKN